jgi:hypothetical protein
LYLVRYTDGSFDNGSIAFNGGGTTWNFIGDAGKFIDYVELYANNEGGGPKVDLQKVGVLTEGNDLNLSFSVALSDGDGDIEQVALAVSLVQQTQPLIQSGTFNGFFEEEQLGHIDAPLHPASFLGIEDETASPDNDLDNGGDYTLTNHATTQSFLVFGGDGDPTFAFNAAIDSDQVFFADGAFEAVTSQGDLVLFGYTDADSIFGYADADSSGSFTTGDRTVFTMEIDNSLNNFTFSLWENIDHHAIAFADDAEGTRALNLNSVVIASDPGVDPLYLSGTVSVIDDKPEAVARSEDVTAETTLATVNALIVLDKSGSMGSSGNANSAISLAKAAILDFASQPNVKSIRILPFDDTADAPSAWFDLTDTDPVTGGFALLQLFLNPITGDGSTNYEDAIYDAEQSWSSPPNSADFTNVYFISDGSPTERSNNTVNDGNSGGAGDSDGLTSEEKAAWETFLVANDIDNAYAIGIGADLSDTDLQEVAYPNTPDETNNVIIINSAGALSATLQSTLQGTVFGNVITNNTPETTDDSGFGADGPGFVSALRYDSDGDGDLDGTDAIGYVFNGTAYSLNGGAFTAGTEVTFDTGFGGEMTFNFLTGEWDYTTPDTVNSQFIEHFSYRLMDNDGDETLATALNITVLPPPPTYTLAGAPDVVEGNALIFTLTLSNVSASDIVFKLATQNGTATGGDDFETTGFRYREVGSLTWINAVNGDEVTIIAGQTAIEIEVDTVDDGDKELNNESMQLVVQSIVSGTVAGAGNDGTETGLIDDNDNQAPVGGIDNIFLNGPSDVNVTLQNAWLLANDTDGDGDPLSIVSAADGTNVDAGTVTPTTTTFQYEGSSGTTGNFTYVVTDGTVDSAPITVNVTRGSNNAQITGGSGNDILIDTRTGGDSNDTTLNGGAGNDFIIAGQGNDTIVGEQNDYLLNGGSGNDTLQVGANFTSTSNDQIVNIENVVITTAGIVLNLSNQTEGFTITGTTGAESMTGGSGNDTFNLGSSHFASGESIDGGAGNNDAVVLTAAGTFNFTNGSLTNVEILTGSSGNDNVFLTVPQFAALSTINLGNGNGDTLFLEVSGTHDISSLTIPTPTNTENRVIIDYTTADSIKLSGAQLNTILNGSGTNSINFSNGGTDTIHLTSTSTALNGLSNGNLSGVEIITAADAGAGVTINLSSQSEAFTLNGGGSGDTLTGGTGADSISAGGGDDTIVGAANDLLLDGGADNDTLNVGANFTSSSNGQIVNVENVTLTAAGTTLNLSNQTEGFNIAAHSGGSTVTAGTGADRVNISAGTSATNWTVNLGSDTAQDKVVFSHASLGPGHNTVATITNFNVAHDRIAVLLGAATLTDGSFQTITAANTNVSAGVEIIELVNSSWVTGSLGNDGDESTVEDLIEAATNNIATGNYTFIVYSNSSGTANAGIYSVNISDSTNPTDGSDMIVEHIMTLNGVGYGNLGAANFVGSGDPIVLDLGDLGIELTGADDGVMFDTDGDGGLERTGWTSGEDGILVMDLDGSGAIENGNEVISPFFNGGGFVDSVHALASLDGNSDGLIDDNDAAYGQLKVWIEGDRDGISQSGELLSLADLGIESIDLNAQTADYTIEGQQIFAQGSFTMTSGETRTFVGVEFSTGGVVDAALAQLENQPQQPV